MNKDTAKRRIEKGLHTLLEKVFINKFHNMHINLSNLENKALIAIHIISKHNQ